MLSPFCARIFIVPNQLPKVSRGAVYLLNFFYFKNNADMMEFANAYLNGVQGYMNAGGCTQHAFESGETPNCLVSFFSFDVDKWVPQNDFWAGNEKVVGGLDKTDYFEANYWGADIPADLDECLQAWSVGSYYCKLSKTLGVWGACLPPSAHLRVFVHCTRRPPLTLALALTLTRALSTLPYIVFARFVHPKNRVGADCSSTMTSFNMKKVDNDQKKVIQLAYVFVAAANQLHLFVLKGIACFGEFSYRCNGSVPWRALSLKKKCDTPLVVRVAHALGCCVADTLANLPFNNSNCPALSVSLLFLLPRPSGPSPFPFSFLSSSLRSL